MLESDLEARARDVRDAARGMARTPGFTALVITVLAMGMGAGTTVFSIMNTLFLRPLRYPHPERPMAPARRRDYLEWQKQAQSFERIAVASGSARVSESGYDGSGVGEPC